MNKGIFFCNVKKQIDETDCGTVFSELKAHGIDGFQFSVKEIESFGEDILYEAMNHCGMQTYIIHMGPRLLSDDRTVVEAAIEQARSCYALLDRFGCKRLMLVPGNPEDIVSPEDKPRAVESMIDALRVIVADAKAHGLTVWFENIGIARLPYASIADVKHIIDNVEGLNYILDTGNFVRTNDNAHDAYEVMKSSIGLVHLKNCGDAFDYRPFSEGSLDITGLMKKFRRDGLDVPFITEYGSNTPYEQIFSDSAIADELLG